MSTKLIDFTGQLEVHDDWSAFNETEQKLLQSAKDACLSAYAPYSNFQVGAAVLLKNQLIIKGNNQENAAYPAGLCAERVALFNASSNYPKEEIEALALTIDFEGKDLSEPVFPCGSCRQVILEYEEKFQQPITLFIIGPSDEVVKIDSIKTILPFSFSGAFLGK